METLTSTFQLIDSDLEAGEFKGHASVFGSVVQTFTPTIIHPGAFLKTIGEQQKRIKILWQHDINEPIGLPKSLYEDGKGLVIHGRVSQTQRGRDAITLMRDGVVDALSIGIDVTKFDFEEKDGELIRHIREVRLWEVSLVTWGADEQALIKEAAEKPVKLEQLSLVPFQDLPIADRDTAWDAFEAEARIRTWANTNGTANAKYRRAFCWYDPETTEQFESYKLQIADIIDGQLRVVPRAVFAAAAMMQGAKGGIEIPDRDRAGCQRHLSQYYGKIRELSGDESITPPWDHQASDLYTYLTDYDESYWPWIIGTRLSRLEPTDTDLILDIQSTLSRLLPAAEPPLEALTASIDEQLREAELSIATTQYGSI